MSQHPHRIVIEPLPGPGGRYYRARYEGEVIVVRSREPEFDACRVLLARGITGPAETWRAGAPQPAMRLDIERAAGLTVVETPGVGPKVTKWKEFRGIGDEATSPRRRGAVQADFEGGLLPT